jgi:hypothetical protein
MNFRNILVFIIVSVFYFAASCFADDPIYEECKDHPRGPWCYQEKVETIGDPSLCENILKYWPKATGVHGWCYYQLALKQKNCELCQKIKKADIKKMCELDACK